MHNIWWNVVYMLTSALCYNDVKCIIMYRKMTFDIKKWRHNVGFSPNLQEMFVLSVCFKHVLPILVIWVTIWEILYIYYLPPTKVAKKISMHAMVPIFFRKHAKLIYIESQKTAGLRPAQIFRKFTKCCRGAILPPPHTE